MPTSSGTAAGAVAWIAGVVLTYLLGTLGLHQGLQLIVGFLGFTGALLSYFGFHVWMLGGSGSAQVGSLAAFTLLPMVLLVGAGYVVASRGRLADAADGFKRGATVAVGYLALALLSIVYFVVAANGGAGGGGAGGSGLIDLVLTVLVTGVVFPVVFGGLGGVLAESI